MNEKTAQMYVKTVAKDLVCGDEESAAMWIDVVESCYGPEAAADVAVAAYSYL